MSTQSNNLAAESWAIADLLRGDFRQSQYGRIILPFCLLRRLECVLEASKAAVLAEYDKVQSMNLPEEVLEKCCCAPPEPAHKRSASTTRPEWISASWGKVVSKPIWKAICKAFPKMRVKFLNTSISLNSLAVKRCQFALQSRAKSPHH
jgi:hypothetical protein